MAVFFCLLCAGALSSTMAQPYIPSSIFPTDRPTETARYNFKEPTQQFTVHVGNRTNGNSSSYEVQYRRHTYKGVLEWKKAKFVVVDTIVSASGCNSSSDTLEVHCGAHGDFEARFIIRKSQFNRDGILDSAVDLRVVGTLHYNGNTETLTEESNVLTLVMYRRLTVGIEGVGKIEVNYPHPDSSNGKRVSYSSDKYPFQQYFQMNHDPIRVYATKTNSCYEFSKWVHEKNGSVVWQASAFDDLNLVSDSGFVAVFEPTCIHVVVRSGEKGHVSGKTRGGKALTSLDTMLQANTTYIFTATPDEKAAFECWTRLDDTECVSYANPINVRSAQDTSLMARFIPLPPKVTLANVDDDTSSMFDHVFGRTTLNFAGKVSEIVADKAIEIYLQYSMGDGWEDTEAQYGDFSDEMDVNIEIDKEANTIIKSGSIKNTLGVFKNIRRKTLFRLCAKYSFHNATKACSDSVVIQWKQPVIFESASGKVIYDTIDVIGVQNKLPTDRSKLGLPRETDTTRYSYHWESNDGEKIQSKTTYVTSEDTIHYHVVADDITFRVRYLDYKGDVYKTDWVDSNTTIKDAPKPNTSQDAAYWVRAVGGSRDLPLVLDGPADIHAAYDYKVRFLDYDGDELSAGFVSYGKAATPPEKEPTRDGYVFDGWDKKFSKVTDTMTVTATYKKAKASSSSSSAKAKSSSSKGKSKSSSSKGGKDAIASAAQIPQFSLATAGREIQVAGVRVGSAYAVLDMQGRVIAKGRVSATDFSLRMDRSATYLVRIGNQTQTVNIK